MELYCVLQGVPFSLQSFLHLNSMYMYAKTLAPLRQYVVVLLLKTQKADLNLIGVYSRVYGVGHLLVRVAREGFQHPNANHFTTTTTL